MSKNKYLEFTILLLAVTLTRAADVIGTYYYTPNLNAELNPVVKLFGLQWLGMLLIQIIGISFIGFINYISLFKTKIIDFDDKGLNFHGFLSMLYFNKVTPWKWQYIYTKNLYGKRQSLNMYGWVIPRVFIYVGLVLIFFFILLNFIPSYRQVHKFFIAPMYVMMFSSLPVCFYWYLRLRFENYKISVS
jgi:hypothetical protein